MATATAAETIPTARTCSRATFSCVRCSERKVKCDRQRPCGACAKHFADCVYSPSRQAQKKPKRVKVQALADRLEQYESLLQQHGIDRNELPSFSNEQLPGRPGQSNVALSSGVHAPVPPLLEREQVYCNMTETHHGTEQPNINLVENTLWRRVVEESHDSENIIHHSDTSSNEGDTDNEHSFMFSARPGPKDKSRFPPTHVMHQLWEAFVENFDPLTKIVHVPSLRPVVERAIGDVTNIPRNLEALISAILGAGILSLKDRDCQQRFGETRRSMLSKYSSATEAALSRAKFMATTSLVVLQALVIHLYSVRDVYEPRTVWTLTGVAVRIAQGLSLDRDGTTLGLSPFDTEIRRRIWWQLKSHDFRTAELCGLAKFRDIETSPESTKWPSNIGGNDLHPKMSSLEITSTGLTDAAFVAFKFEMTKFAAGRISIFRKRGIDSSQWNLDIPGNDKEEIQTSAETLREALEMKYLRYCDPSQPLHLVLLLVGRYGMNIVTFLTHHPRRWAKMEHVTPTERVLVWDGSIKLLDQYSMMQSNPIIQQFAWHAPYFIQWHAFIHVLDTLRAEPLRSDALKAWQLVESIYESTPELGSDLKKPIHVAIGNLCLKAYRARETALLSNKMYSAPTPTFIRNLRHRRENAIEKRKAREAKMQRSSEDNFVSRLEFGHSDATQSLHQSASTNTPKHNQADTATEVDPLRLFDGFDDNLANELYMDLDFDLPSDYSMQDYAHEPIDWSQWDAWLANSNVMRSSTP